VKTYTLLREQVLRRPRDEVFAFFADAGNLERITPPFLRFRVVTPAPVRVATGTLIDYRLSLFGVPFGWRTRIEEFEPAKRFVDAQLRGPYRLWRHTHAFEVAPEGTRMLDRVEYAMPLGPLGRLARALFVRATLDRIFDYRARTIEEIFAGPPAASPERLRGSPPQVA
jgi:ligand-binding SRPBCC domain-containing protein